MFWIRELWSWRAVPLLEFVRGPGKCLVEVAEVARIRASGRELGSRVGALDEVAARGVEQAIGRVRHVAVEMV